MQWLHDDGKEWSFILPVDDDTSNDALIAKAFKNRHNVDDDVIRPLLLVGTSYAEPKEKPRSVVRRLQFGHGGHYYLTPEVGQIAHWYTQSD
jgi:hypothetical protein